MADLAHTQATQLREALLDQLAYLVDEVEALKAVVDRVPEPVQEGRPLGHELSIKEIYGLLAVMDEQVYLPRLQQMVARDDPAFETVDEESLVMKKGWNEQPIEAILQRVQEARTRLVAFLRALPPEAWTHTGRFGQEPLDVYRLAHHITQHDAGLLRTVSHRLHESRLTNRPQDLPK